MAKPKSPKTVADPATTVEIRQPTSSLSDFNLLAGVTLVALAVRLYKLNWPTSVVFDEVHFGGFASKYIKGQFFMDVHPPLAKMLFAVVSYIAGFDGEFDFKDIGKDYLEPGVPYVAMRLMPALLGVALVSLTFLTLRSSGCSQVVAVMASLLVTSENGLLTNARLILLDSPLITLTALTAYAFQKFTIVDEDHRQHLTRKWWLWLALSGLSLGATVSVKWVGLFTIAWLGTVTIYQLFTQLGNVHISLPRLSQLFLARALCLLVLPGIFYMGMFAIHFQCLVNPGDGDGFMSSEFQSSLNTKAKEPTLAPVSLGNTITLKHWNTQGGYLHSHVAVYPGGSKQQQVTLYPHQDANNEWMLYSETDEYDPVQSAPVQIQNGQVVKLWHATTQKRLHSHDVRPIVTEVEWQNEVSAYGFEGFSGDANDLFRIEIQDEYTPDIAARHNLTAISSKFRLIHVMTGAALFSHKVKLPSWGFEQQEVTAATQGTIPNSIWYIESNTHPLAPADAPRITYRRLGFFGKFWELHKVMWTTNAGLVESHNWDSRPSSWPLLKRGINFWGADQRHVYLIGNFLVRGLATGGILAYLALKALGVLRWQRGFADYQQSPKLWSYDLRVGTYVLGWAFHYLPFFLMERQLFLHHYFPALYFSILAFAQLFDFSAHIVPRRLVSLVALVIVAASAAVFYWYAPVAYGLKWTKSACEASRLVKTWDYDCNPYPDSYAEYSQVKLGGPVPTATAKPVEQAVQPEIPAGNTRDAGKAAQAPPPPPPQAAEQVQEPSEAAKLPENIPAGSARTLQSTIYQDEAGNVLDPEAVKKMENVKDDSYLHKETTTGSDCRMAHADHTRDPCPYVILNDFGGAFAMGAIGGSIWHSIKGYRNSPRGEKLSGAMSAVKARAPVLGGNFGVWGGLFSTFDCSVKAVRRKEDPWNAIIAGFFTGGSLAVRSGVKAARNSAIGCACLLGIFEGVGIMINRVMAEGNRPVQPQLPEGVAAA
ncbi:Protein mannosyltransferase 1 [Taphrina deformans PYCC 5710]|uniref:Dolichyl-phosphate-mannose--protein mannosyltransferase n=1 Tax=Taphrina deformans (strain PYCC 5710 / ATCC 11124 / CBS 356.35 / IMI 108563 / JCM 9778 / NBRC 8474) TaxID=1097556 RepID=R4X7X9_TAPDE|nr:Protein mannosyltransferase 1 [Taphrina deformans PYCC 5710]|eukprot:CCG81347.1 Protein mannosyltransferase 1 [Taphrina deformans PYCC 5710]